MNELMDIPKTLRQSGLKATLPRLRILQLFHERGTKHLSAAFSLVIFVGLALCGAGVIVMGQRPA